MPRNFAWLTPLEASKRLGVSVAHVYALADRGRIRTRYDSHKNGRMRFSRPDVEALAALRAAFPGRDA